MAGYIINVTIENSQSPVWRRLVIPEHITFAELHQVLQIVFGWKEIHLHGFTVADGSLELENEDEERKIILDDYLTSQIWIKYIYDFGDNWEHEIVLEKIETEYTQHYAKVLEYKGNNFLEDSGGIWEDIHDKDYNIKEVNDTLEKRGFSILEKELEDVMENDENIQEIIADFQALVQRLFSPESKKEKQQRMRPKNPSKLEKMIMELENFCEEKEWIEQEEFEEDFLEEEQEEVTNLYEQLTLPFFETEKEKLQKNKKKAVVKTQRKKEYSYEIVLSNESWEKKLDYSDRATLEDFCHFLQISYPKTAQKKKLVKLYSDFLIKNPAYLCYVFGVTEYKELRYYLGNIVGKKQKEILISAIETAIQLGLATIDIEENKKECKAVISFANEAKELLYAIDMDEVDSVYERLYEFEANSKKLLMAYGVIEFEAFCQMQKKYFKFDLSETEYLRLVYWHGCMEKIFYAQEIDEKTKCYILSGIIELENVVLNNSLYESCKEYYPLSKRKLQEEGYDYYTSEWQDLAEYLISFHEEEEAESIDIFLFDIYIDVVNGECTEILLEEIELLAPEENLATWVDNWLNLMDVYLATPMPMLKGYSRAEFSKKFGVDLLELCDFGENFIETEHDEYTGLSGLPGRLQLQIYDIYNGIRINPNRTCEKLEKIQKEEKIESSEFLYLLASLYVCAGKRNKAEKIILELESRLRKDDEQDSSVSELKMLNKMNMNHKIDELSFMEQISAMQSMPGYFSKVPEGEVMWDSEEPFQREEKKIGRNDPCPCGSGKKYKKCCGR